jgi:hypothetical protein
MLTVALLCASFAQLPPLTPKTADEFLAQLHQEEPDYLTRVRRVAEAFVGVPYAPDPLGEGPGAPYDDDPLIDLTRVDARSFVDQCLALAAAPTLEEATQVIAAIRYIRGEVSFARRNHLMLGDWVINNTFVSDITRQVSTNTAAVKRFINRKEYFADSPAQALFENTPNEGVTIRYILNANLPAAQPNIPDASLIVFIGMVSSHFGSHCGLYFRGEDPDAPAMLYHASPAEQRVVVSTDLAAVAAAEQRVAGIQVYAFHPERIPYVTKPRREEAAEQTPAE